MVGGGSASPDYLAIAQGSEELLLLLLLNVQAPLLRHVQQARDPYVALCVAVHQVGTLTRRDQVGIAVRRPCVHYNPSMGGGWLDHAVEDFCGCLAQLIGGVDVALPASFQWTLLHVRVRAISLNDEGRVGFDDPGGALDLQAPHLATSPECLLGAWRGHVIVQSGILQA